MREMSAMEVPSSGKSGRSKLSSGLLRAGHSVPGRTESKAIHGLERAAQAVTAL
jgi:hypothetical protein